MSPEDVEALLERVGALEAERDCRNLLSLYGYGADYDDPEAWLDLFTDDAVVDTVSYVGSDPLSQTAQDLRPNRMQGRDELRNGLIKGPQTAAMADFATQHHMSGNAANFMLTGPDTAVITTYGVVYGRRRDDLAPHVTYQSHTTNRWSFRRVGGQWRIAELVRRRLGNDEGGALFHRRTGH